MSLTPKNIWNLKLGPWTEQPRYHPPGQHPANYRDRACLRNIEELGQSASPEADYLRNRIAEFEQAESESKARDDYWLRNKR